MNSYAIYDSATGKIDRIYQGTEAEAQLQPLQGESVIEVAQGVTDVNSFVVTSTGTVESKQAFPISASATEITADGVDELVITGIPVGTTVTWPDGQQDEVTDGEVRFSVDLVGTYTLRLEALQYLTEDITVEAIPAA